jgi:hypothetical protein
MMARPSRADYADWSNSTFQGPTAEKRHGARRGGT